jgi:hypothetical protein
MPPDVCRYTRKQLFQFGFNRLAIGYANTAESLRSCSAVPVRADSCLFRCSSRWHCYGSFGLCPKQTSEQKSPAMRRVSEALARLLCLSPPIGV